MRARYVMGIDLGGGGGRCLVLDADTGTSVMSNRAWTHTRVQAYWPWAFDLDVDLVWRAVGEMSREVLARSRIAAADVAAIGIASMRHGMIVIDAGGSSLFATPTLDARAGVIALQLSNDPGARRSTDTRDAGPTRSSPPCGCSGWLNTPPRHWRVLRLLWVLPTGWDSGYPVSRPPAGHLRVSRWSTPSSSKRGTTT